MTYDLRFLHTDCRTALTTTTLIVNNTVTTSQYYTSVLYQTVR